MVDEVGVGEDESLNAREDAFNRVEPRCVGGRVDERDIVGTRPADDFDFSMRRRVVQDDVEALIARIAISQVSEEAQDLPPTLTKVAMHEETVILQIIG